MHPVSASERQLILEDIERRSRAFERHFSAREADRLVAGYFVADELEPLASPPGGSPPVAGRAGLTAMFSAQFTMFKAIRLEAVRIEVSATQAFELGRAHLALNESGEALGRYTVLWVKTADGWRAKIDFFAADGWPG
jgi:ketosteroid isomerase-like protein